jgi:thymidylate synthase (FAD)
MRFLQLRADAHAQYEIRAYANTILEIMKAWVPITHEAFLEYRLNSASLSATACQVLRRLLSGEKVTKDNSGLSLREWDELLDAVDLRDKLP